MKRNFARSFLMLLPALALGLAATCSQAQEPDEVPPPPTVTLPAADATFWTTYDKGIVVKGSPRLQMA